ncbi:MAG: hypothetical protein U1F43_12980 [Myxococcota bacterium]
MQPSVWSPELSALVRPYRTLARLAATPDPASPLALCARRPLLLLVVVGAFVSLTTAGRLVLDHLGWSIVGWAFLPALQVASVAATTALVARRRLRELPRLVDLSYLARAPWLVFLVLFTLVHTTLGDPRGTIFSVVFAPPVLAALAACLVWTRVLDHAFWRAGVGLSWWRALVAVVLGDVFVFGPAIVWYLATEQLQPILASS